MAAIQITVFTGFLGSGKTTTILSLLKQLPKGYNVVLLKNEFGDIEVDSKIAEQSAVSAVSEILNGCMCCILVGQMKNAMLEIRDKYRPDRIIIESSGSALPAALALQIRQLEAEFPGEFKLDSIITVVDAENFEGYEDQSPTARLQAKFCDVILINKWENVTERQLDIVIDHLHTLNDLTPKLKCKGRNGVSSDLIFGIDTKLYSTSEAEESQAQGHDDEVETCTIWGGRPLLHLLDHDHNHNHVDGHSDEPTAAIPLTNELLESSLATLPKECIYRVKGFVSFGTGQASFILNWAFGRFDLIPLPAKHMEGDLRLTMMGERGETKPWARKFAMALGANVH